MTALTIIQNAATRLGISSPTAVFSSTNNQVIQLRNLMNQEGVELSKGAGSDYAWTALMAEKTFTSVAAAIQTSAVPTDFNWYINETFWNRTTRVPGYGPVSPSEWQTWQANGVVALPNFGFRFRGGDILIYPTPTAGDTMAYEYVSTYWCETSGGSGQTEMAADTDVAVLNENLITLGVIWRFLQSKGLDYAEAFRTYQVELTKAMSRDGGKPSLRLEGGKRPMWRGNIPEGSW